MTSEPSAKSQEEQLPASEETSQEAGDRQQAAPNDASEQRDQSPEQLDEAQQEEGAGEQDPSSEADRGRTEEKEPGQRRKIQIGSRRGDAGQKVTSSKPLLSNPAAPPKPSSPPEAPAESHPPEDAGTAATSPAASESPGAAEDGQQPAAPVPRPTRRDRLTRDIEQQVDAALQDVALEEMMTGDAAARAGEEIELESRRQATVVRLHGDHVFLSLGGREEGVVSVRQFKEPPGPGQQLEVVVKRYNAEDSLYEVAVPGASLDVSDWSDLSEGAVVEARITGANTGGLECMVSNIRGFIPASQIGMFRVENFGDYIGQKLLCVATEVKPKRKNLVLSHRAYLEREREEARQKLLESLEPGQTAEGVVRNLRDFGAFVDLGGVDGLIHISQLSWDHISHPKEVLEEGQKVRVKIQKINRQTGKIALTYRDLLEHPWENVEEKFPVGSTVKGPVSRVAKFGAFVKLASGVEGLIHISELAHHRVRRVEDVVREGEEVEVKVLSVDSKAQRIGLSLKATLPEPEEAESGQGQAREPAVQRRKGPLKGGVDHPSGGEQFGLKW